jgi:hypothetical protein
MTAQLNCVEGQDGCAILDHGNRAKCSICHSTHYLGPNQRCLKNSDFDYPFYKSFLFWAFILLVIIGAVVAQILYQKSVAGRTSNVSGVVNRDDQSIQPETANQTRLIERTG